MSYNFKVNRNYKINTSGLKIKTDDKNNASNNQNMVQINLPKGVSNAAELVSYLNSKKEEINSTNSTVSSNTYSAYSSTGQQTTTTAIDVEKYSLNAVYKYTKNNVLIENKKLFDEIANCIDLEEIVIEEYYTKKSELETQINQLDKVLSRIDDTTPPELIRPYLVNIKGIDIPDNPTKEDIINIKNSLKKELSETNSLIAAMENEKNGLEMQKIMLTKDYQKFISQDTTKEDEKIAKHFQGWTYIDADEYDLVKLCELVDKGQIEWKNIRINDDVEALASANAYYMYMTEDERNIYYYLYSQKSPEVAKEYLENLSDEINQKAGYAMASERIAKLYTDGISDSSLPSNAYQSHWYGKMNPESEQKVLKQIDAYLLETGIEGTKDGINTFFEGLENVFEADGKLSASDYEKMFYVEYLKEHGYYGSDSFYEFNSAVANMIPSITTSVAVSFVATPAAGSLVGTSLMGLSAGGNAKERALQFGADNLTALKYGITIGLSESLLQKLMGRVPGLNKMSDSILEDMFMEGLEEFSQEWIQAGLDSALLNQDIDLKDVSANSIKSFIFGALISGKFNLEGKALNITISNIKYKLSINDVEEFMNIYEIEDINERNKVLEKFLKNIEKEVDKTDVRSIYTKKVEDVNTAVDSVVNIALENNDYYQNITDDVNYKIDDDILNQETIDNGEEVYTNFTYKGEDIKNSFKTNVDSIHSSVDSVIDNVFDEVLIKKLENLKNRSDISEEEQNILNNLNYDQIKYILDNIDEYEDCIEYLNIDSEIIKKLFDDKKYDCIYKLADEFDVDIDTLSEENLEFLNMYLILGEPFVEKYESKPNIFEAFKDTISDESYNIDSVKHQELKKYFNNLSESEKINLLNGNIQFIKNYINSMDSYKLNEMKSIVNILTKNDLYKTLNIKELNKFLLENNYMITENSPDFIKEDIDSLKYAIKNNKQYEILNWLSDDSELFKDTELIKTAIKSGYKITKETPDIIKENREYIEYAIENAKYNYNYICSLYLDYIRSDANDLYLNADNETFDVIRNHLKEYVGYGANQHSITDLALNPSKNLELYFQIEKIAHKYYPNATNKEILQLFKVIDDPGICTYATFANELYTCYYGKEEQFKNDFGYDMYRIENGEKILNDELLLTDLFCCVNKDNIHPTKIRPSVDDEVYLSHALDKNVDAINNFFKEKGISKYIVSCGFSAQDLLENDLVEFVKKSISSNITLELCGQFTFQTTNNESFVIAPFSGTKHTIDGDLSHSVFITGIDESGNIIISTYGKECIIKIDEIKENPDKFKIYESIIVDDIKNSSDNHIENNFKASVDNVNTSIDSVIDSAKLYENITDEQISSLINKNIENLTKDDIELIGNLKFEEQIEKLLKSDYRFLKYMNTDFDLSNVIFSLFIINDNTTYRLDNKVIPYLNYRTLKSILFHNDKLYSSSFQHKISMDLSYLHEEVIQRMCDDSELMKKLPYHFNDLLKKISVEQAQKIIKENNCWEKINELPNLVDNAMLKDILEKNDFLKTALEKNLYIIGDSTPDFIKTNDYYLSLALEANQYNALNYLSDEYIRNNLSNEKIKECINNGYKINASAPNSILNNPEIVKYAIMQGQYDLVSHVDLDKIGIFDLDPNDEKFITGVIRLGYKINENSPEFIRTDKYMKWAIWYGQYHFMNDINDKSLENIPDDFIEKAIKDGYKITKDSPSRIKESQKFIEIALKSGQFNLINRLPDSMLSKISDESIEKAIKDGYKITKDSPVRIKESQKFIETALKSGQFNLVDRLPDDMLSNISDESIEKAIKDGYKITKDSPVRIKESQKFIETALKSGQFNLINRLSDDMLSKISDLSIEKAIKDGYKITDDSPSRIKESQKFIEIALKSGQFNLIDDLENNSELLKNRNLVKFLIACGYKITDSTPDTIINNQEFINWAIICGQTDLISKYDVKQTDIIEPSEEVSYIKQINDYNPKIYYEQVENYAKKFGVSHDVMQNLLNLKAAQLIEESNFGCRISVDNLVHVLEDGCLKTLHETGTSDGLNDSFKRKEFENSVLCVPEDTDIKHYPVSGELFPIDDSDIDTHMIHGAGRFYGAGSSKTTQAVIIFNKDSIMNDTTFTIGDSLNEGYFRKTLGASWICNPKFRGAESAFLSKESNLFSLYNANFNTLFGAERVFGLDAFGVGDSSSTYLEIQLHGEKAKSASNIEKVVFLVEPPDSVKQLLEEQNIKYRVTGEESWRD